MTVKELITELKKLPQDIEIYVTNYRKGNIETITEVVDYTGDEIYVIETKEELEENKK